VTLPDGSTQRVLVPQVYVRVQAGDIDGAGTLLAGREIKLNVNGDLTNTNCVSCVNAAQQRLTGQNPNAVASPSTGYANQNALLPSAPFGFGNSTSPISVIAEMQQAGNGAARLWIFVLI
jgi:hypothetical protein